MASEKLEKLQSDLQRIVDRQGDYIEDTVKQVSDAYFESAKALLDEVTAALEGVDSDDVTAVAKIRNKILDAESLSAELIWDDFSDRLDKTVGYIDDYFERTGRRPAIDKEVIETLKGAWPTASTPGSGIAADIHSLSIYHQKEMANAVTRNVLGGLERRQMVKELAEKTDRTRWQARQLAHDATMAFSRTVEAKKAAEAGFEYFEYMGPLDSVTRPFCRQYEGRVLSRAEINELDNGQTGKGSSMLHGGGYNCRHDWNPVERDWFDDDEWAQVRMSSGADDVPKDEPADRDTIRRTKTGELTDGVYRVSPQGARRHAHDTDDATKSRFDEDVDVEEIALEAAQQADFENAWKKRRAIVDLGKEIGVNIDPDDPTRSNKRTRYVKVYRRKNGVIHATPHIPRDDQA